VHSIVVLNQRYEYHTEAKLKKVVKWLIKDKAKIVVEKKDQSIRSEKLRMGMPMVVCLIHFKGFMIKSNNVPYSDYGVYDRDNNRCQYWHHHSSGKKFVYQCTEEDRTIDHVTPKSRGGKTSYENCVCCCRRCNELLKKDLTPKQAGMELIKRPTTPQNRRGEMASFKFAYNPHKPSHKVYMEEFLQKKFSRVAKEAV